VVVRYVVQVIRTLPREEVFAQIAAAVRVVQGDPRVVALNLVAPEDDPVARRDYDVHMRAVAHLTERGTLVPVTLHAGELTPTLVPPEDAASTSRRRARGGRAAHRARHRHRVGARRATPSCARWPSGASP
jgi:adenosine deaminase